MNAILQILSALFQQGVALRHAVYRRGWRKTQHLNQPVVSVGNLNVGGTGKTPLVILTARMLASHGHRPCILTRGYGRRAGNRLVILEPGVGRRAEPEEVGDEPAAMARALPEVPIIVCADRYRAGTLGAQRFQPTVYLLDDGFQHLGLARDLDIVLLDVTRPASEFALLPAGRLREPFSSLRRAQWVILTRTELADGGGLEARVQAVNPQARIFHCSTVLAGLLEVRGNELRSGEDLLRRKVAGFCGIGNPAAFFADLRAWGFPLVSESVFPDHHRYLFRDLEGVATRARKAGAEAILTTEKDMMNLPPRGDVPLPIFACCIQPCLAEKMEFERALLAQLDSARRTT